MDELFKLLDFVQKYGSWGLLTVVAYLFFRILLDEDRSAIWRARIYRIAFQLSGRIEAEKKYISNDVKGKLNLARRSLHYGKSLVPRAVDVVWVEGASGTAHEIREGEFVVRLNPSSDQEKNIALLASAIVKRSTLQGIRHSVEEALQTSIDLNLIKNLLMSVGNKSALDYFLSKEYKPLLELNNETKKWNNQIVALDERGLLTQVLLVELEDFARRIYGKTPRPYMAGEIEGLVEFLYRIADKKVGEQVPLSYLRAFIRVSVILVAKTGTLLESIEPYVMAMQSNLEKGFFSIYVIFFDKDWLGEQDPEAHARFVEQVKNLRTALDKSTEAVKHFDVEFDCVDRAGKRRRARCIRYTSPSEG